jgi:C1A family cysteine protease
MAEKPLNQKIKQWAKETGLPWFENRATVKYTYGGPMLEATWGGLGWRRDLPDFRDYTPTADKIKEILDQSEPMKRADDKMPKFADLREWCSPIEDQDWVRSCTACAGMGVIEYFQRRAFGKHIDGSRMFLYKVTRNLIGDKGDSGAFLRDTMKAMVLFGVPPEEYWPYIPEKFEDEPPAFCYAFAQNYKAMRFFRLDPPGAETKDILANTKKFVASHLPVMFGFSTFSSMPKRYDGRSDIPVPTKGEKMLGGHAVVAVGFDDNRKIGDYKGALLIRNSWGLNWGENGYGWLPYEFVRIGLAVDFWSLVQADFVDTDLFK